MTAENLRRQIRNLRNIAEQPSISPTDSQQIKDVAENIREMGHHFNESEHAYIAEVLFKDNESSLLSVLKICFNNPLLSEVIGICASAFALMVWKLDVPDIERYCVPLWNLSAEICRNEGLKSSRESGFELLIAIMDKLKLSEKHDSVNARDLVRWCWEQVDKRSKLTSTVKKGLFHLMGALCKFYPELMLDDSGRKHYENVFAMVMAAELKEQMLSTTKAPVYAVIDGCLAGINGLLCNFPEAFDAAGIRLTMRDLYNCAKMAANPAAETTRLGPKRAALELLATHAPLFKGYFYEEYKLLYGYFRNLAMHTNRDLKYAGLDATEKLLKQLSIEILDRHGKNRGEAVAVYEFFVNEFIRTLRFGNSTRAVSMCAKGYGQFAPACKALYGSNELNKVLIDITSRCEEVFMLSSDPLEQKVTYIPTFLEAFSMVFTVIDEVPADVWLPVETLHILLFQHFPLLDPKYHHRCVVVSYQLFNAILPRNDRYIDTVVYQSLVRLCSLTPSALLIAGDEDDYPDSGTAPTIGERDPRNLTYRDYLPLWRQLLSPVFGKAFNEYRADVNSKDVVCNNIADALLKAIMEMLDRLDFTLQKKENPAKDALLVDTNKDVEVSSNPVANVVPNKTTDLCLLVNLADFTRNLLASTSLKSFSEWFFPLSSRLMELSTRFPLVSGFYKMLTLCLQVGSKMKLLEIGCASNAQSSFDLFSRFIDEVSIRMKQYKDDLFVSCLELVLAVPSNMVITKLDLLADVIKSSLELGISYLPLAEACLNALERWTSEAVSVDSLSSLYRAVLPCFDEYLRSEGVQDEPIGSTAVAASKRSSKRPASKKDIWKAKARMKAVAAKKSAETARLNDLRTRILLFIGKLGGEINKSLVEQTAEEIAKECVAWDTEERLKFSVPFPDMKPTITFDSFLPRICELAVRCGNRQTKIAACELLHSLVLLLLGKAAAKRDVFVPDKTGDNQGQLQQRSPFHKLYRQLFPLLLQLCCDADEVPKQLFRTLITQSIHWFTSNRTSDNPETAALLDSLMDGVVRRDATLRDYCAECLNEFLRWSLKHSVVDSQIMIRSFRSLLKRLYSLASHPDSNKRLGAALAFNSIYRTFREEELFIDLYTFEILAVFMNSLARSHNDEDRDNGTVDQLLAVTRHLDRIVQKKKDLLVKHSDTRKLPNGWNGSSLRDCVNWLFEQVGRPQRHFRQRCFELLISWIPLVEGLITLKHFVEVRRVSLFEMFENGGINGDAGGIRKCPTVNPSATVPVVREWLSSLEAALDCYQVCFDQSVVTAAALLDASARRESLVLSSLQCFLQDVVLSELDVSSCTPLERRALNSAKCHVTVRALSFVTTILSEPQASTFPFLDNFWSLLIRCCFNPSSVGFDMTSKETVEQLPRALHAVLSTLKSLPASLTAGMVAQLTQSSKSTYALPTISKLLDGRQSNWLILNECLIGYEIATSSCTLPPGYFPTGVDLWRDVSEASFTTLPNNTEVVRPWLPSALLAARSMLKTAAKITAQVEPILSLIFDQSPVLPYKGATRTLGKGQLWFGIFRPQIAELVARNSDVLLPAMVEWAVSHQKHTLVGEILVKITDFIARNHELRKELGADYVKTATVCCRELLEKLSQCDERAKCACIAFMQKLFLIDTKFLISAGYLFDIFVKFLSSKEASLRFQNKALLLLGPFASVNFGQNDKLAEALNTFVVSSFPFRSTEFKKGSSDYDEYLIALRRMVFALEVSDNILILDALIKVLSREKEHSAEVEIAGLLGSYCRSLSPAKYESIILVPFNFFFCIDQRINDEHRLNCLSKFLLPMLNGSNSSTLSKFFLDKALKLIMEKLEAPSTAQYADKHQITTKLGCMRLLELMYDRLDATILRGPINENYLLGRYSEGKNELIKKITSVANSARKLETTAANMTELMWQYRCAAHNLLIAVLSKTQRLAKLFEKFIFDDAWKDIIDPVKSYAFKTELEDQPKRKQQLLNLQKAWRTNGDDVSPEELQRQRIGRAAGSLQFLSSQFLAESSLQSDVSEYDFTAPSAAATLSVKLDETVETEGLQDSWAPSQKQSQAGGDTSENLDVDVPAPFDLEADELNLHPCMEPMINVIKLLVDKGIAPTREGEMPAWMALMLSGFNTPGVQINTKLFIARIIVVLEDSFASFGNQWFEPLAKLILDPAFNDNGLNYFRVDIIATLLKWSRDSGSRGNGLNAALKSNLFQYCMTHTPSDNSQMFKRNLRLLNLILELWKDCVKVNSKMICDRMKMADIEHPGTIGTGIQLLGVVLANGVDPMADSAAGAKDVYRTLAHCLCAKSSKTYKLAAEVAGLLLQLVTQQGLDFADDVEQLIVTQMNVISSQDRAKFISCLHAIQRHYPGFSDKFLINVLAVLPNVHGEFKAQSLEVIFARAETVPKLYSELKARGVFNLLDSHDQRNQIWAVKILWKIVERLSLNELLEVMPSLCSMVTQASSECRRILAELFMRVYDKQWTSETAELDSVIAMTKEALLLFLNDPEPPLRLLVFNFWSHETRLPKNTTGRLLGILKQTYSEATEREFLGHATYLLLELTSRNPDYKQPIFDTPLQDCRFEDMQLSTSWKRRYATLEMPAFAESMQSQHAPQSPSKATQAVRATAIGTPQFSQTVAPGHTAFDWMTGATYDTFAGATIGASMEAEEGGLLFTTRTHNQRSAERNGGPVRRMQPSAGQGKTKQADEDENILKQLKRRIIKDNRQTASEYFARMQTRREKTREKLEEERKKAREQNVQLYRNYRHGDFPDVQIPHSAILAPLQALAQQDSVVASLLFAALLNGVYKEALTGDDSESAYFSSTIADGIANIITNSKTCYKPMLASLQMFCFRNIDKLQQIDPEIMCTASLLGHQQHMAVVLLERYLLCGGPNEEKEPKRRRIQGPSNSESGGTAPETVTAWASLAKLYKSLSDRDAIRVVFGHKLPSKPVTNRAFEAETSGDYQLACDLYTKAMRDYSIDEEEMSTLDSIEFTMWEEYRLKCLDQLNKWSDLSTVITRYIDDNSPPNLDLVWDNSYSQVLHLPYLLRAKLKQLCSTEEDVGGSFTDFLNNWINSTEKKKWLEDHHANLMTLYALAKHEYGAAGHLCRTALKKFLAEWSSLLVTDHGPRQQCLQSLQELAEMDEYIDLAQKNRVSTMLDLERVLKRWEQRNPGLLTASTSTWNDVMTLRHLCTEQLCQKLLARGAPENDAYQCVFKSELRTTLEAVTNALHMRNYGLAFSLLEKSKEQLVVVVKDDAAVVEWAHAYARAQHVVIDRSSMSPANAVARLISAVSLLGRYRGQAASTDLHGKHSLLEGTTMERLGWLCLEADKGDEWIEALDPSVGRTLKDLGYDRNVPNTVYQILRKAFPFYEAAVGTTPGSVSVDGQHQQRDAHLALAEYCDRVLRSVDDVQPAVDIDCDSYPTILTKHLLLSMKNGCRRARQLFPRLIEVSEKYPDAANIFKLTASNIPCWMFLGWLSQITAVLNKPFGANFHGIIESISSSYPEALVYCFGISKEHYAFGTDAVDVINKEFVERISEIVGAVKGVKQFIRALLLFSPPGAEVKDMRNRLHVLRMGPDQRQNVLADFYSRLFALDYSDTELGAFWKEFRAKFQANFDAVFGARCRKLMDQNAGNGENVEKLFDQFGDDIKQYCAIKNLPRNLASYSRWLSEYDSGRLGFELEIPGQYDGEEMPIVENHVRISGFSPDVIAFNSMRIPKKLTILGNDGKEYAFLVKPGEDLRQDERIQRLFIQMNQMFSVDAECRRMNASIRTYGVIPLTSRLGIIGFVPNAKTLRDFLNIDDARARMCVVGPGKVVQPGGVQRIEKAYMKSYEDASHDHAVRCFLEAERCIPKNTMRDAILRLCSSPDGFYCLRSQFTSSYSTICIAGYILGVGDRHLGNIMIDESSATAIAIDFGHAFGGGVATPIPELTPFRMTQQIREVFEPIGIHGQARGVMVACLRCLRENSYMLLNTMNVFVNEPSVDWLQEAEKLMPMSRNEESENAEDVRTAYAPKRLEAAKQRLRGENPVTVTEAELNNLPKAGYKITKAIEVIYGKRGGAPVSNLDRQRPRGYPANNLAVEEQVCCLIDMATDPLVLARTWLGWAPWI